MENGDKKIDNKYLLEKQLETLKIFYDIGTKTNRTSGIK